MTIDDFDKLQNYVIDNQSEIIENLEIELGSDKIPRISCANHKLNLAVRTATLKHPVVSNDFYLLNKFAVKIRNNTIVDNIFRYIINDGLKRLKHSIFSRTFFEISKIVDI
jgi:hypothetical protein